MIRNLAIAIVAIFLIGLCFMILTVWNNVFYNPDTGLTTELDEQAQDTFNDEYKQHWNEQKESTRFTWGLTGVFIFAIIFIMSIIIIFQRVHERHKE